MSDPPVISESARPAVEADVDRLVAIATEHAASIAGQRGADLLLRRELHFQPAELDAHLRRALTDDHQLLVVGSIDAVVFGYGHVVFEHLDDGGVLARLEQFVVEPEAREVGIGEAVMNLIITEARKRGCFGIDSRALPGDRETKNFFESFGLKARQLVVHLAFTDEDDHEPRPT